MMIILCFGFRPKNMGFALYHLKKQIKYFPNLEIPNAKRAQKISGFSLLPRRK